MKEGHDTVMIYHVNVLFRVTNDTEHLTHMGLQ